ncbi:hypothetical protein MTO96_032387 [Rhipicephalus appendiculatus]
MDLESLISKTVPWLGSEAVRMTVEKLQECGVQTKDHLSYIQEEDLAFLNPVTRRMLIEKFRSAGTAPPTQPVSATPSEEFQSEIMSQGHGHCEGNKKDCSLEYEAAPLLLLALLDEDDEYFFRTVEFSGDASYGAQIACARSYYASS